MRKESTRESLCAILNWRGDSHSEVKIRRHTMVIESSSEGGAGLTPTEVFLASLGSCIMVNISRIGQKMKLGLKEVHIEVTGVKESNDHPSSFVTLNVDISINADTQDHEKLERLVQLAEENCTISNTLRNAVKPCVKLRPI
ncbi:MAG: OsmC family protein [Candidatus Bathyarchaeia archaeon]